MPNTRPLSLPRHSMIHALLAIWLLAPAPAASAGPKPFEVKSGIVEMTNSMMKDMKQTLYFDDFGAKQAMVTSMAILGTKSETVAIDADGWHIEYDVAKKTGTRRKGFGAPNAGAVDVKLLSDEMKKKYKVAELAPKTIDGKEAKGYSMEMMGMKVKAWVWKGITLHAETDMGGKAPVVISAKSISVDVPVPAERFTVPAGIKLTDI